MTKGKFPYNILRWIHDKSALPFKDMFLGTVIEPKWNWWFLGFFFFPSGCEKKKLKNTNILRVNCVSTVLSMTTGKLFLYQDELTYYFYWLETMEEKC